MNETRGLASVHNFLVIFLIAIAIVGSQGDPKTVNIQHREVKSVVTVNSDYKDAEFFQFNELCSIATNKFPSLPVYYFDEESDSEAKTCTFEYENGEKITKKALVCATVPSIYLTIGDKLDEIIAITVKSVADDFKIIKEIVPPMTIELARKDGLQQNRLSELSDADRQNLCIEARKRGFFIFTNNYVLKPHTFDFVYTDGGLVKVNAIPCPSYPPTYLRLGQSKDEIILTFIRTIYEIEIFKDIRQKPQNRNKESEAASGKNDDLPKLRGQEDRYNMMNRILLTMLSAVGRQSMCRMAFNTLNYASNNELDPTTPVADYFEFDYGYGLTAEHFVVRCFQNNDMFLYLEKVSSSVAVVKILLYRESKMLRISTTSEELSQLPQEDLIILVQNFSAILKKLHSDSSS